MDDTAEKIIDLQDKQNIDRPNGIDVPTNAFLLVRQKVIDQLQEEEERSFHEEAETAPPTESDKDLVVGISGHGIGRVIETLDTGLLGNPIGNVYEKPYGNVEKTLKEEQEGYKPGVLDFRG